MRHPPTAGPVGPKLTVVVPATDRPPTLARCVAAVNGAVSADDEVIVISEPPRSSPAAARNSGVVAATGDVVVFVDADVEVRSDALARLRARFASDPELVAVFGSYDDSPEVVTAVSGFRNLLHHHVHQAGAGPAETFWTGLGAVRRQALADVGGFDAVRFPHPSIEDIELGARLSSAGAKILLDPAIQGKHLKRWTLGSMVWTDFARRGVPWTELIVRTGRLPGALNLSWRNRLSAGASLVVLAGAASRRPRVVVTALGALLALNQSFYRLLLGRLGPGRAVAGVGLHVVHHVVSAAALVTGTVKGVAASWADGGRWR